MFEPTNDILFRLSAIHGYEEAACNKRRDVFTNALKILDAQGIFGAGAVRETVVANIMWGDQDVRAHIESARELNPIASYLLYARHELPSLRAWEKEIKRSKSMYKDEALARIRRTITQVDADLARHIR